MTAEKDEIEALLEALHQHASQVRDPNEAGQLLPMAARRSALWDIEKKLRWAIEALRREKDDEAARGKRFAEAMARIEETNAALRERVEQLEIGHDDWRTKAHQAKGRAEAVESTLASAADLVNTFCREHNAEQARTPEGIKSAIETLVFVLIAERKATERRLAVLENATAPLICPQDNHTVACCCDCCVCIGRAAALRAGTQEP